MLSFEEFQGTSKKELLSFEEFQGTSKKELLSFEEFQSHVLEIFNASKEECKFCSSSYHFLALINYTGCQWLFFTVKYSIDPDACSYGRWSVVKEKDKGSDSLVEAIEIVSQKTEIAVFKK